MTWSAWHNHVYERLLLYFTLLQRKERQEQHAYKLEQDLALCKLLSILVISMDLAWGIMVTSYAFSNLGINGWLVSYFLEFVVLSAA